MKNKIQHCIRTLRLKWLTAFDLDKLTAGATKCFERIGSDTIQRVNAEFATRRTQFKTVRLRWRVSRGSRRSLGWIPLKAAQLKRKGKSLRFAGKAFRIFERELLEDVKFKCGCFAQDSVGDWWLCLPVAVEASRNALANLYPPVGTVAGGGIKSRPTVALQVPCLIGPQEFFILCP